MEIIIKSKFAIDDIVYTCYNGHMYKFKVTDIEISYGMKSLRNNIQYECVSVNTGDFCIHEIFAEDEIFSKDEFEKMFDDIMSDNQINSSK